MGCTGEKSLKVEFENFKKEYQNEIENKNKEYQNKIDKLEEEINNLKKYHESINYNDENKNNGMEIEEKIIDNNVANNKINVVFRIDGKKKLSVPAYPNDRLKDLFSLALKRNDLLDIGIDGFKFFLGVRNISSNFISNDPISSLNLIDNWIIEVHT